MKAIWRGQVIAESDRTLAVGGYEYFPRETVRMDLLRPPLGLCSGVDSGASPIHQIRGAAPLVSGSGLGLACRRALPAGVRLDYRGLMRALPAFDAIGEPMHVSVPLEHEALGCIPAAPAFGVAEGDDGL